MSLQGARRTQAQTREVAEGPPVVVAQVIKTTWSKQSRGAPMASLRNAVPERLALTELSELRPGQALVQRIGYSEWNCFAAAMWDVSDSPTDERVTLNDAITLQLEDSRMKVAIGGSYHGPYSDVSEGQVIIEPRMGAPRRSVPHHLFTLEPGEWGQIRYMGRQKGWEDSWYEKWVCNIGWFRHVSRDVFLDTEPTYRFESMPDVW